jgi:hypothetical protein
VILGDNGASTLDTFEIQLLLNGNVVYQEGGPLLASCGGGVVVDQNCQVTPPPVPCVLEVSAAFEYLGCEIVRQEPPSPPKCDPNKPDHCRKHCPQPRWCKKHKNTKQGDDCQKVDRPNHAPAREVCEVRLTYVVKNSGSVPIASLTGTDTFGPLDLSSLPLPLAPGASIAFQTVEEISGPLENKIVVTANQNDDGCSASAEIVIQKPSPEPPPCQPPKGPCDWEYWKSHPECWPVQTITYCGKTYSIAEIIAALEKLSKDDWFKNACERWLTDHLNRCKGD